MGKNEKQPYRIHVSQVQVECVETAAGDLKELLERFRGVNRQHRAVKERLNTPLTGVSSIIHGEFAHLEEAFKIFSGLALSLRERGKAEMVAIKNNRDSGSQYRYNVAYHFTDNHEDAIVPLQCGCNHGNINQAVAGTLFDAIYPDGKLIWAHQDDIYRYFRALEERGWVRIIFPPKAIVYYI